MIAWSTSIGSTLPSWNVEVALGGLDGARLLEHQVPTWDLTAFTAKIAETVKKNKVQARVSLVAWIAQWLRKSKIGKIKYNKSYRIRRPRQTQGGARQGREEKW